MTRVPRIANDDGLAAMLMTGTLANALTIAAEQRGARLAELKRWLAIPSVSSDPARAGAVHDAAAWLGDWLTAVGARAEEFPTAGGPPVVVGRVNGPPAAPTVLVYGHYDVQPPGPGWATDAFVPVVRDGILYARGANDDKGQLFAHLAALDAWRRAGGPPVTVVIVAEGAEEVGSPGFAEAISALRRQVGAPAIVVSDTERAGAGRPAMTVSQRGHIVLNLRVDTQGPSVHPGRLGGAVVDPSMVLAAALVDLGAAAKRWGFRPIRQLPFPVLRRSDVDVRNSARGRATRAGKLHRRVSLGPAVTVTTLRAGDRSGTAPGWSSARLDIRLPPGADPKAALDDISDRLRRVGPAGVRITAEATSAHRGHELVADAGLRAAVEDACMVGFGRPPAYLRSGGTIPAVGVLADTFRTTPALLGLGTPAGGAHGPDEQMDLRGWSRSIDTCVALLTGLARHGGLGSRS
jgi:succinyl-diaminopimelate desuccinylase